MLGKLDEIELVELDQKDLEAVTWPALAGDAVTATLADELEDGRAMLVLIDELEG